MPGFLPHRASKNKVEFAAHWV